MSYVKISVFHKREAQDLSFQPSQPIGIYRNKYNIVENRHLTIGQLIGDTSYGYLTIGQHIGEPHHLLE
jgi:hypothetical protein